MLGLKIAFRNLLRHKRRSLLSGLTLACGYILLSLSQATTEGTYSNLIEAFTREHTGHVQIHRRGYLDQPTINKAIADPEKLAALLEKIPGVVAFAPRVLGPALANLGNKTLPAEVQGIDLEREPLTTRIRERLKTGRFPGNVPDREGRFEVLLGAELAESLKARLGDEVVLISQGADGSVANDRFVVAGTIGTPDSRDRLSVYMSITAAQAFFTLPGRVHEFAVVFADYRRAEAGAKAIAKRLKAAGEPLQSLEADPWQVLEADFYRGMTVKKKGNAITYMIILFIVAVGVLNVVLMAILERTREFGVLKAIGTRPLEIFRMILMETGILAAISVGAGLLVALPLNLWFQVYGIVISSPIEMGGIRIDRLTAEVSLGTMGNPALMVIGAALVICLLPAVRAARIRVVDALRST
ncbi:MAG: ABC transporter permease [Syntrophales bacterium]|nr:ABC transporter permease [Syntrophales bacterium]